MTLSITGLYRHFTPLIKVTSFKNDFLVLEAIASKQTSGSVSLRLSWQNFLSSFLTKFCFQSRSCAYFVHTGKNRVNYFVVVHHVSRSLSNILVNALMLLVKLILSRLNDRLLLNLSRVLYLIVHSLWLAYLPWCLIGFHSCDCLDVDVALLHLDLNFSIIVIVVLVVFLSILPIRVLVRLRLGTISAVRVHMILCHL